MNNNELLDDKSIEVEYSSSILIEIGKMGRWLMIPTTIALLVGSFLIFISFLGILFGQLNGLRLLFAWLLFIIGVILLLLGVAQFKYLKAAYWIEKKSTSYRFDNIFECNLRIWKWTAIFFGIALVISLLGNYI